MMKIGSMWKDITESLFKRPATERYPFEKTAAPQRLRGMLIWDAETCSGCTLCQKDCPAEAIEVEVLDRKARLFNFTYYADRCTFCAQCVHSCNKNSIELSHEEWELAALDRQPFCFRWHSPEPEPVAETEEA
jgi:formate hydrogenlyase subunit 6/NADH:ubiquinone oxidoreductase subunit I